MINNAIDPDKQKNVLILSYGPVPTPEFQKIEGGGMRCWGLATGLRDNGHNVTVGVFEEFKQNIASHEDINLYNWKLDAGFAEYINSFDAVIVSYSMGDLSMFVADKLSHHITLVLDCYVPIFIEVSARDSENKAEELKNYLHELGRYNHVLKRGDYFLCANIPQKHMYSGILGSLGILNPYSYRQDRLLLVPFGIDQDALPTINKNNNPYSPQATEKDFILLWFGGLYPWFNFKPLVEAVRVLSKDPQFKFFLVGGKNPYNNHPDFVKQYDYVTKEFSKSGLLNKSVYIVDWIDFSERINWYQHADAVISINQEGEENEYSWRTRVMDYLWGNLPMLTNGGDPLSDELIDRGGAIKIELSTTLIIDKVNELIRDRTHISEAQKALAEIRESYYWSKVTSVVSEKITADNNLPFVTELTFRQQNHLDGSPRPRALAYATKAASYAKKARKKGIKRSARLVLGVARSRARTALRENIIRNNEPKAVLLSHPIDDTGAPLVLLAIAKDLKQKFKPKDIHIASPVIKRHLLNRILSDGFIVHKMAEGLGNRVIHTDLSVRKDDFVLMNTVGVYKNYRRYAFWLLQTGRLNMLHWFIHEDNPELRLEDKKEVQKIKSLVAAGKLQIYVPSRQTADDYNRFFDTDKVKPVTLRVDIEDELKDRRSEKDFDTIKFFISGIPLDGRKGQLLFLAGLQQFNLKYRDKKPNNYRPYSLDLVAMGKDYISQQIETLGRSVLGENLHLHPVMPFEKALQVAHDCNVTVCTSLNETFALYVAEGMHMGHVVLRNYSSGWHEQVEDGKNGYLFDGTNVDDLADKIELLLNKKTPNSKLVEMSKKSQKIATKFSDADYCSQLLDGRY